MKKALIALISILVIACPAAAIEEAIPENYFPEYMNKCLESYKAGNYSQVLASIKKMKAPKKQKPARDKLFLLEGMTYKKLGQFDNAKKSLEASRKLRAANSDMLYALAVAEHQLGNSDKAAEYAEEALWFGKHGIYSAENIKVKLALLYKHTDQPEKAAKLLKTVPHSADSSGLLMLAEMQLKEEKKTEAVATLRKLTAAEPENPEAKIALASALLTNTDRTFGRRDISEAKSLVEPIYTNEESSNYLKHEALPVYTRALIESGELGKANKELSAALKRDPNNPEYQRLMKQVQIEQQAKNGLGEAQPVS